MEFRIAETSDDELLGCGVPAEWLKDVKKATEDTLLALTDHLPAEAAEALLELATGGKPRLPEPAVVAANPFDHPDAQRRFRMMTNVEELQRALDFPWEKWTVFLHPEQRQWVERDYTGPARVAGSAGTGKTIVAWSIFERVRAGLKARRLITHAELFSSLAVVMACDDEIIPLQERIETVGDSADLHQVYDTERHLLYVACMRARDHLLVTSVAPSSEFLDDMQA
jgi:hypothetical protein